MTNVQSSKSLSSSRIVRRWLSSLLSSDATCPSLRPSSRTSSSCSCLCRSRSAWMLITSCWCCSSSLPNVSIRASRWLWLSCKCNKVLLFHLIMQMLYFYITIRCNDEASKSAHQWNTFNCLIGLNTSVSKGTGKECRINMIVRCPYLFIWNTNKNKTAF